MKKIKQITIPVASEVNDGAPGSATLAANVAVLVAQRARLLVHVARPRLREAGAVREGPAELRVHNVRDRARVVA